MTNRDGLLKYLKKNGQLLSWKDLAEQFNYPTADAARNVWLRYRQANINLVYPKDPIKQLSDKDVHDFFFESNINKEKGTSTIKWISSKEALTEEEVYKECKVDKSKWIMTQIWHKKRGTGFVYSANFKLIPQDTPEILGANALDILNNYHSKYIPISPKHILKNMEFDNPCLLFISLTDAHIGRLTTNSKTLEEQVKTYLKTLDTLLYKAYQANFIDEIVYVIGNDLSDADTFYGTTTNGTQQFNNAMWDTCYEAIFDCQVKAINKLKQFCNKLNIMFIPGNHARTKEFFLVHGLAAYFKNDKNIIFNRSSDNTKFYIYGENFIAAHHGDTQPVKLPLYFASKYYKDWGKAKHKFIFLGDKHHKQSWNLKLNQTGDEIHGVRMSMTPALCGNSQWEKQNLFDTGIAAGICTIFDKRNGQIMEIEERI